MSVPIDYLTLIIRELAGVTDQQAIDGIPVDPQLHITTTVEELEAVIRSRVEPMLSSLRASCVTRAGRDLIRNKVEELGRLIDTAEDRLERMYSARRSPDQSRVNEEQRNIDHLREWRRALTKMPKGRFCLSCFTPIPDEIATSLCTKCKERHP